MLPAGADSEATFRCCVAGGMFGPTKTWSTWRASVVDVGQSEVAAAFPGMFVIWFDMQCCL